MTRDELRAATVPFRVRFRGTTKKTSVVIGFSQNDPLGVGGGIFPDMACAYFEKGGWLLLDDLLEYYELAPLK